MSISATVTSATDITWAVNFSDGAPPYYYTKRDHRDVPDLDAIIDDYNAHPDGEIRDRILLALKAIQAHEAAQ